MRTMVEQLQLWAVPILATMLVSILAYNYLVLVGTVTEQERRVNNLSAEYAALAQKEGIVYPFRD